MLKDLFLHTLIILLPIFLYQVLAINFSTLLNAKTTKYLIGILSGFSSSLCMVFPINMEGFLWDLRFVPLFISFVYGGFRSGAIASVIVLLFRFFLPYDSLLLLFVYIIHIMYCVPVLFVVKRYPQFKLLKKISISIILTGFSYLVVFCNLWAYMKLSNKTSPFELKTIDFFLNIFFIEMLAVALTVLLMETYLNAAKMRNNIIHSEKLNVVSQLAASVAHEVRNPLTVVRGFLQLIKQSPTNEKNAEFIRTAITELDRAEDIIGDYLNLAKPQLEKIEVMNTLEELQKIADLMASYASMSGVGLQLSCNTPSLYISGEKAKFAQAMINIIKNSIEATSSVGGVVRLEAFRESRHVIIKVIDSGHGMAKEELKRLGTPFYSTKSKGTGLGLMVTFQIIQAMEGKIEYSSEKNAGTTVTITLPAH